ncbi:MAG: class I tRNA ligase family protein, partial [Nanoarchaeota archaeon]
INLYPEHIKEGRFGKWLEGAKDWALSRSKFWGTPLPIWRCSCGKEKIIGSIDDLRKFSTKKINEKEIDLHKPWIDTITLKCDCGKAMKRLNDVIDCWYDSGSASFAQLHYPFENKKYFEKLFPYDFISEAIDQTRGWFYTLHVLGTILFNKPTYKNVICAGHIVDEKGEKMSKSKGNIIKPDDIINKIGVDAVRLQFCTNEAGNQKRFSYELMKEEVLPFLTILQNCYVYYEQQESKKAGTHIEDDWIISKLHSLISEVEKDFDEYQIHAAFEKINRFVVGDFSRNYIKMIRDRDDAKAVLGIVLETVALLIAPFAPYISEYVYSHFSKNSVHLSCWPQVDQKKIDKNLEEHFILLFAIIEKGLAEREGIKIGLKWPLAKAIVHVEKDFSKHLVTLLENQLNVKKIELKKSKEIRIELDTTMTPQLEAEGYAREISRKIQAARKKASYVKTNKIRLGIITDASLKKLLETQRILLQERTNAQEVLFEGVREKNYSEKLDEQIKDKKIKLFFGKV